MGWTAAWIVERGIVEHGAKDAEQPVGHAAQGAVVPMPVGSQASIVGLGGGVVQDGDARHGVRRTSKAPVAGSAHVDSVRFAAGHGDRR